MGADTAPSMQCLHFRMPAGVTNLLGEGKTTCLCPMCCECGGRPKSKGDTQEK